MTMAMRSVASLTWGAANASRPLTITLKLISGCARASRVIASRHKPCSVASVLRNFLRAGTLANILVTDICVPAGQPAGAISFILPVSSVAFVPSKSSLRRVNNSTRAMEAMLGIASPRKPNEATA